MLRVNKLKKYFGGVKAVDYCSFEVKENTITALIGPNGAGKSTVFNLVSGLLIADSGKIYFDKKNLTNLRAYKTACLGISRLFQQTRLFDNLTVRENLLLALDTRNTEFWRNLFGLNKITKVKEKKVREILDLVDMGGFLNRTARDLSYGQKRLIELSRAILMPHKLLMLDEPVAGVNPRLRNEIKKILKKLKEKGETILLIEHDMNFTFGVADTIVVMEKGKVIAEGTPNQIKHNKKVLEAYLE